FQRQPPDIGAAGEAGIGQRRQQRVDGGKNHAAQREQRQPADQQQDSQYRTPVAEAGDEPGARQGRQQQQAGRLAPRKQQQRQGGDDHRRTPEPPMQLPEQDADK